MTEDILYNILDHINRFTLNDGDWHYPLHIILVRRSIRDQTLRAEYAYKHNSVLMIISIENIQLFKATPSQQVQHPFGWKSNKTFTLADPNVFDKVVTVINEWLNWNIVE